MAGVYIDNISIKGPRSDYNNKKVIKDIRRFVLKYI
jgi:hypothetical protein